MGLVVHNGAVDSPPPSVGVPQPEPPGDERPIGVVVLVAAVGLAAGLLGYLFGVTSKGDNDSVSRETSSPVVAASSTSSSMATGATSSPPTTASTSTSLQDRRLLGERVPGLTGTLLIELGGFPNREVWEWPADRAEPIVTVLPAGVSLDGDVTRRLYAGLGLSAQNQPQPVMYVGPVRSMRPAAMNVTSLAWHNTTPGRLAWLQASDGGGTVELRTGEVDPSGVFGLGDTISQVPSDDRLLTWDSWGFLLTGWDPVQDERVVYLVDSNGAEQWRLPALDAHVSPSGQLLLTQLDDTDEYEFLSTDPSSAATQTPTPVDWAPVVVAGEVDYVAWSPDADQLAFLVWEGAIEECCATTRRIEVWGSDGATASSISFSYRVWDVEWGADGRFVLVPGTNNAGKHVLLFYDTVDNSLDEIEFDTWVQQVFTREGLR